MCGCVGVHATLNLRTNGLHDVGARGHGVAIAQKTSIVRDQVVENQRSVERTTARRDHTPSFCLCGLFSTGYYMKAEGCARAPCTDHCRCVWGKSLKCVLRHVARVWCGAVSRRPGFGLMRFDAHWLAAVGAGPSSAVSAISAVSAL